MSTAVIPTTNYEAQHEDVLEHETSFLDQPLPRITIQAFCITPGLASAVKDAAGDRRLVKTHVSVHMGGVQAAITHFSEMPTPNLVVLEADDVGPALFRQLEELAQVCDPGTKVVIAGPVNDVMLYRELIRQGVSEYVVTPTSPIQLIEAFATLYYDPSAVPLGRTFAFVGAKGGVGSSTLAHNVAWYMAETMHEDTVVMDMDIEFGTLGLDFNRDPTQTVLDALTAPDRVDDMLLERLLVKTGENLRLFTAPATLDQDYDIPEGAYEHVLEVVRQNAPSVVIDMPHVWTGWSKRFMLQADEIIITATPDLASLRNAKSLFDVMVQARPNDPAPRVVVNQTGVLKRPEIPVKEFAEALSVEPEFVIPFDGQLFGEASNNGLMLPQINAQAKSVEAIEQIARALIGRERAGRQAAKKSPFDFLKAFSFGKGGKAVKPAAAKTRKAAKAKPGKEG
ncbi:AAA family ATPase [Futiania mangrovi]|uniref:AAA family ATPase n=1 Tax=Futiania mangrovi TaxID=2959716 RepID=A0A9J6PDY6_9PROT|nr:AAA family ATPase [Futiania mangrovii]MCP1336873.1 AAA family ATPase [Futiania mangrovii]